MRNHNLLTSGLQSISPRSVFVSSMVHYPQKHQYIHNSATLLLTHHITPVLQNLIWLTVNQQIYLRLLLITHKALHNLATPYPTELLH